MAITEFQHFGTVDVQGDSTIAPGASLTIQQIGINHTPYAALENDGTMTVDGGTFRVGYLTGDGVVRVTDGGNMQVMVTSSDTIQLESGHLEVGLTSEPSIAKLFKAPITDFGADSTVTLDSTTATAALFKQLGDDAGEMLLYSRATLVADLHISGQPTLYASFTPGGPFGGSVTISAHEDGHSLPPPT